MARETKIGMLVGLGVILLIGIIISDHLAAVDVGEGGRSIEQFGQRADAGLGGGSTAPEAATAAADDARRGSVVIELDREVPSPDELDRGSPLPPGSYEAPPIVDLRAMRSVPDRPALTRSFRESLANDREETGNTFTFSRATRDRLTTASDGPAAAPPREPRAAEPDPDGVIHYLGDGETLYDVARRYLGDGDDWPSIVAANRGVIVDPDRVSPGVRLRIPAEAFSPAAIAAMRRDGETAPAVRAPVRAVRTVAVEPGDTLSKLAEEHLGDGRRWGELFEANRDRLDSPDAVRAGMKLELPVDVSAPDAGATPRDAAAADARDTTYTVRPGDTLAKIARRVLGDADRWDDLFEANRDVLDDPDAIRAGQTLKVPN